MPSFALHNSPAWLFYLCMMLGLCLHVLLKIDAWWKPEFAKTGVSFTKYFEEYPLRSIISIVSTVIVGLLMRDYGIEDALAATAAGYIGNSMLDALLGQRKVAP